MCPMLLQVKEYKADLVSLKEQLKQAAAGASEGDAARAELGLGDNYYSTSGAVKVASYAEPALVALGQGHWRKQPVNDTHWCCELCQQAQSGTNGSVAAGGRAVCVRVVMRESM